MSYACNGKMAAALREYMNHVLRGSMVVTPSPLITGLLLVHEPTGLRASVRADGQREAHRSPWAAGLDVEVHRVPAVGDVAMWGGGVELGRCHA